MKKNIIISLILILSIWMVGCEQKEEVSKKGSNNSIEKEEKVSNEKDNDDYYDIFMENLPEVRVYFESLGINLEEEKSKNCSEDYDFTMIKGKGDENSEIYSVSSGISFSSQGKACSNFYEIRLNIDESKLKTEEFCFEDSAFYPLAKIILGDNYDCTDINKLINDYYQNNGDSVEEVKHGVNVEQISCDNEEIMYTIYIN